jgi:glycosyltransferase involved in cell wall biosynthesis
MSDSFRVHPTSKRVETTAAAPRLTALIPAHNERGRIGRVLAVLHAVDELEEIVVVDDGSTDDTQGVVQSAAERDPRLRCLRLPVCLPGRARCRPTFC